MTESEERQLLTDTVAGEFAHGGVVESLTAFSAVVRRGRTRRMFLIDENGRMEVHAWTSMSWPTPAHALHCRSGQQVRAAVLLASDVEGLRLALESAMGRDHHVKVAEDGSVVGLWRLRDA